MDFPFQRSDLIHGNDRLFNILIRGFYLHINIHLCLLDMTPNASLKVTGLQSGGRFWGPISCDNLYPRRWDPFGGGTAVQALPLLNSHSGHLIFASFCVSSSYIFFLIVNFLNRETNVESN